MISAVTAGAILGGRRAAGSSQTNLGSSLGIMLREPDTTRVGAVGGSAIALRSEARDARPNRWVLEPVDEGADR